MFHKYLKILTDPIYKNNPVIVQVLGICSALAVTVKLQPAVIMALSLIFVTAMSNVIISIFRKTIPQRIRIIVQLVVVAFFVIIIDQFLKAYVFNLSKELSVYVGLIITNCIIMGRIEAFALQNKVFPSFLDGLGNGIGYGLILIVVAFLRELFGSGTIWNIKVVPDSFYELGYQNNSLMILPPMALIIIGIVISIKEWQAKNNRNKKWKI